MITCTATDANGDTLTYGWTATCGSISGGGPSVTWSDTGEGGATTLQIQGPLPPILPATGSYTITCTVRDPGGLEDSQSITITVTNTIVIVE